MFAVEKLSPCIKTEQRKNVSGPTVPPSARFSCLTALHAKSELHVIFVFSICLGYL